MDKNTEGALSGWEKNGKLYNIRVIRDKLYVIIYVTIFKARPCGLLKQLGSR